jgi:hypothetical protein
MPILKKTDITGRVAAVLTRPDNAETLEKIRSERVRVTYDGFDDDSHATLTRASCVRVRQQYEIGTEIRNVRQISVLSAEELAEVAVTMEIPHVKPEWVGANLLVVGIPDLTQIPPSTRLIFESGAALVIDMENGPCKYPGAVIEGYHPGHGSGFPKAALNRRGVTAWVEREGEIAEGDAITVHIPPQRIWLPAG